MFKIPFPASYHNRYINYYAKGDTQGREYESLFEYIVQQAGQANATFQ